MVQLYLTVAAYAPAGPYQQTSGDSLRLLSLQATFPEIQGGCVATTRPLSKRLQLIDIFKEKRYILSTTDHQSTRHKYLCALSPETAPFHPTAGRGTPGTSLGASHTLSAAQWYVALRMGIGGGPDAETGGVPVSRRCVGLRSPPGTSLPRGSPF